MKICNRCGLRTKPEEAEKHEQEHFAGLLCLSIRESFERAFGRHPTTDEANRLFAGEDLESVGPPEPESVDRAAETLPPPTLERLSAPAGELEPGASG